MHINKWLVGLIGLILFMPVSADVPPALRVTTTSPLTGGANVKLGGSLTLACPTCAIYPSQTGHAGEVLTTNGTTVSWAQGLPDQTSHAGEYLYTNGTTGSWRHITQDDILAAFAVSISAGPTTPVEVGTTVVNPQFTVSRTGGNSTPISASFQDYLGTQSIGSPTITAIGYGGAASTFSARSYAYLDISGCTSGGAVCTHTWTYSATNSDSVTKTGTRSVQWQPRIYYGAATPGTIDEAFIEALPSSTLGTSVTRTITMGAGSNTKKWYYCYPAAFTAPATWTNTGTGFGIPKSSAATGVSVTNAATVPVTVSIDCQVSDQFQDLSASVQIQ
jgi:hypothetical protein